jgi:hypothetical protein
MQLSQILMCENRIVYFSLKLYCRLGQIILADFLTKRHVTKKNIILIIELLQLILYLLLFRRFYRLFQLNFDFICCGYFICGPFYLTNQISEKIPF